MLEFTDGSGQVISPEPSLARMKTSHKHRFKLPVPMANEELLINSVKLWAFYTSRQTTQTFTKNTKATTGCLLLKAASLRYSVAVDRGLAFHFILSNTKHDPCWTHILKQGNQVSFSFLSITTQPEDNFLSVLYFWKSVLRTCSVFLHDQTTECH